MTSSERSSIREVARLLGTSCRTLRYYEEIGLLETTERGPGGVRQYTAEEIERLKRILDLRNTRGFTLEEIKEFLSAEAGLDAIRASFHAPGDVAVKRKAVDDAEQFLRHELAVVEAKLKGLAELRQEILDRLERAARTRAELN